MKTAVCLRHKACTWEPCHFALGLMSRVKPAFLGSTGLAPHKPLLGARRDDTIPGATNRLHAGSSSCAHGTKSYIARDF